MIVDGLVVTCSLSSFIYLFWKVRSILLRENVMNSSSPLSVKKNIIRKLKVPCAIATTYITLNFSIVILLRISPTDSPTFLADLGFTIYALGLISDCLIYVFMQPNIRSYMKQLVLRSGMSNCIEPTHPDTTNSAF